jgi:glycosyltransferase involved in cell wall biosynthesis
MGSNEKLIAIIDPVGKEAGMDYYDQELLLGFNKLGYSTYLFSNVTNPLDTIKNFTYFKTDSKYFLIKVSSYFISHIKSFVKCKTLGVNQIILHIFGINFVTFIVFIFAKLFALKIIAIVHDVSSFANDDLNSLKKIFYKYLPNYIVVHNNNSYNELRKLIPQQILKKVHVIQQGGYPNFIGKVISKQVAQTYLGLPANKKYLLFFGQIKKIKRLDLLISALSLVGNDVELIIAGKPWKEDYTYYNELINELGLTKRVHTYIRFIEDSEKDYFFYAADIVVLPYDHIFQSAVILLAMTYGKIVVASDIDGFKETITHNLNGMLFRKGDFHSLADTINKILLDNNLSINLTNNMIEPLNTKFSWNNIAVLYDKMLS